VLIRNPDDTAACVAKGWLRVGRNTTIEENVEICHPTRSGETKTVVIGDNCHIRSGSIIYSGVTFGNNSQTGHQVVVRENNTIGNRSVLGTGVKVEMNSVIGNHVLIETQCHITAYITFEDYVFMGPACVTTNDQRMLHRRAGAGAHLKGAYIKWGARIGGGTVLLPAVTIGREAIVAAGSVVARDVPDKTIAAGNPARLLGAAPDDEPVVVE
jgi:UDP-2-acetamido-3-amino-2,3-dideoxy-glucuronate N-acetyltransferase